MSDISLSKAVRSNLLSLQNTASLMTKTQERLATGNKVNSALDNPTNFFTAAGLNARAGDLNQLMDSMANGIQTLEAADNGLTAITKTLESMQSTLRQARQDKTFQTQSFEISSGATGNIAFSGGALGSLNRSVALQNTALTNTALGMAAASAAGTAGADAVAGTDPGTSGSAQITFPAGSPGTLDTAATMNFTVTVDGGTAQNVSFTAAEWSAATAGADATARAAAFASALDAKVTGATVTADSGVITITSSTAGTSSNVSVGAATVGGTAGSSTATGANIGLGSAVTGTAGAATGGTITGGSAAVAATSTITWGGNPLEINKDAKISFTANIGGEAQTIEITRADVLKAGNGDGTINSAEEFAAILSSKVEGATFAASGNTITMTSETAGADATFGLGAATVTGLNYNADELVAKINADSSLSGKIRASNDDGKLRIENQSTQELNVNGVNSSGLITGTNNDAKIGGNTVRADLAKQFNELRDQLDKLADDASFNGINLLRGDKLTITFNETGTSSIDIQTKGEEQINAANLSIFDIEDKDLDSDANIDTLLGDLKSALNDVRSQSSAFGSNLSIVENRQAFTKNMVNTLQTGAANLTLADMNEEAANLLALQTRQSLSSNSLSLAAQADQSILQLIR
jgi:flagellin